MRFTANRSQRAIALVPLVAILIVIVLALVLGIFLVLGSYTTHSGTARTQTTSLLTCTDIPAISYEYCPSSNRISAVGSPGAIPTSCPPPCGSWNFTATINSASVAQGQPIVLVANLTNLGPNQTFTNWIAPFINPYVSNANGTKVWSWDPPAVTFQNYTVTSGQVIWQNVSIPTSRLASGQSYFIAVTPLSVQFPTPNNYTFTFRILVS